jgi:hypothetical protein
MVALADSEFGQAAGVASEIGHTAFLIEHECHGLFECH